MVYIYTQGFFYTLSPFPFYVWIPKHQLTSIRTIITDFIRIIVLDNSSQKWIDYVFISSRHTTPFLNITSFIRSSSAIYARFRENSQTASSKRELQPHKYFPNVIYFPENWARYSLKKYFNTKIFPKRCTFTIKLCTKKLTGVLDINKLEESDQYNCSR